MVTAIVISVWATLFLCGIVYSRLRFRHATFEAVPALPGEQILFEDTDARVSERNFRGLWMHYPGAAVRVTNRRVLIGQRALFTSNRRVIRFTVFTSPLPQELGAAPVRGYLTFSTRPDHIGVSEHKGRRVLKIVPTDLGPPTPRYLLIDSPRLDEYLSALGPAHPV